MLRSYLPSPTEELSLPTLESRLTAHTDTFNRFLDLPVEIQSKVCDAYCSQKFSLYMSSALAHGKTYMSGPPPPPLLFANREILPIARRSWLASFSGRLTLGDGLTEHNFNRTDELFRWLMDNVTCLQTFPHGQPVDRHFLWPRLPRLRQLEVIKHMETKYVMQCFDSALSKHKSGMTDRMMEKWNVRVIIEQRLEPLVGNGYGNVTFALMVMLPVPEAICDAFWKQAFLGSWAVCLLGHWD